MAPNFLRFAFFKAYRRAEGDFQGNEDTLWESVVFEGVAYASGFFLAFSLFGPFHSVHKICRSGG